MSRWEDLPWKDRIVHLDLTVEEKNDVTRLILKDVPADDREVAVPKDKAVAIDSIRKRLKASGKLVERLVLVLHCSL